MGASLLLRFSPLSRFDGGCVPESSADDFLRLLDLPGLAAARMGDFERERDLSWIRDLFLLLFLADLVEDDEGFGLLLPFPLLPLLLSSEALESLVLLLPTIHWTACPALCS